ncbi:P-loop containing nucleoside triphosphate hydrolase protein [Mycotypha africana]|uniref:P-loop containing nucleoside triphosphate hydrolase protein n=1 Tax=Mycotypha africana TaxID=64632 RepID=UPI002300F2E0|nr:P-loop containing nucleoside triphosphate hydrolase protein [Mycotypha africana]KAI8987716.1 P-loop containing nucleoside triphosphate hydrolase protein [Mycotypha africana]
MTETRTLSRVAASQKKGLASGKNISKSFVEKKTSFSDLGLDDWLCDTLKAMAIKEPTEIQRECIPPILAGKDVIGGAKTGSGKTAAFALPILQKLSDDPYGPFALVLTPTRELAFQIAEQFRVLGKGVGVKECVVVGGMGKLRLMYFNCHCIFLWCNMVVCSKFSCSILDMMKQALELSKKPHVIIATPGRLRDHIRSSSGAVDLRRCKFLVMDEADRMLSPTFVSELEVILPLLPKQRQTLLFTATMTESILALRDAEEDPKKKPFVHVCDMSVSTVATLDQYYIFVPSQVKMVYLAHLLRTDDLKEKSVIIFCGRCSTAQLMTDTLKELGIRCTALHSEMTQQERLNSLGKFRAEVIKILISTDVGSRGLDIPSVECVLNYDIPRDPTDYIHRVGRTARAGRGGKAISIVAEKDIQLVQAIEARIGKQMEKYDVDENEILEKLSEVTAAKRVASMVRISKLQPSTACA